MKHKTRTKALSWLVSLALILSLVPTLGTTAKADNGSAYNDYLVTTETNKVKSGDELTALQVTFNGKPWYIIADSSASATSGTVTLLAADGSFGKSKFSDNNSTDYNGSTIKAALDAMTTSGGSFANVADAIMTNNDAGGKLYLLSKSEVDALPIHVKEISFDGKHAWWTRTSDGEYIVLCACLNGEERNVNSGPSSSWGVRPALQLDLSTVTFFAETKTFTLNSIYTVEGDGSVTLDNMTKEQLQKLLDESGKLNVDLSEVSGSNSLKIPSETVKNMKELDEIKQTTLSVWMKEDTGSGSTSAAWYGLEIPSDLLDGETSLQVNKIIDLNTSDFLNDAQKKSAVKLSLSGDVKCVALSLTGDSGAGSGFRLNNFGDQSIKFYISQPDGWSEDEWKNTTSYYLNDSGGFEPLSMKLGTKETASGNKNYGELKLLHCSIYMLVIKANQSAPAAPTMAGRTIGSVTLNAIENGEYRCGDGEWQESPAFTGLDMNTEYTFYQRLKGDVGHNASPSSEGANFSTADHVHGWSYSADGATITAICANTDGGHGTPLTATLTIVAPQHTNVGDGKSTEASITDVNSIRGDAPVIYYAATKSGAAYAKKGAALESAPTGAGDYVAEITVGGVTASVGYTIDKAASSVTTAPTAVTGLIYNNTARELVNAGTASGGTIQYAIGTNNTTAPTTGWSTDIPSGTDAGTYYVWYKVVGDADHSDSAAAYVEVTIGKAAGGEATISTENMSWNDAAMTITGVAGQEYIIVPKGTAINEESWTRPTLPNADGGVRFTHLTPATEYTIYTRVAETANAVAGAAVSADVNTTLSGTKLEFDSELVGATVTVNPDPAGTYSYQWYQDAVTSGGEDQPDQHTLTVIAGATAVSYTPTDADVGKYLAVKIKKGDSEVGETVTPFSVASTATVTFNSMGGSAVEAQTGLAYDAKLAKPADPERTGYHFAGWYTDTDYSTKWSFDVDTVKWADTTLYAKWTAAPVYEITGVVKNSSDAAVSGAAVTLAQGYKTLGQTTTDENGAFTFTGVESGTYNVIAKKDTQTKTELVELTENKSLTVTMPETGKNSVLDNDNAGDLPAIVGGLDKIAAEETVSGDSTVTITLTVTAEDFISDSKKAQFATEKAAIQTVAAGKTLECLDLTLQKVVTGTGAVTTNIGDSNTQLLTIIIPYATSGKQNVAVYRYHGTEATAMTQNPAPGAEGFVVGTDSITLYAKGFSTYAIGYTTPTYSGGGSSGGSSGSTITVPVSGDSASVSVSASVSGSTATVKAPTTAQLDKVIGESVKTGDVTIDVSGLKKDIATVSIPTETVKAIETAVSDPDNDAIALTVKLTDGSVTFDAAALAAIAQQAKGSTIQLNLDGITESGLRTAQKTAIKDMDVQAIYDAYLTSNGQRISDFKGGKATVTVSYTLKDGQTGRGVVVWYVADDGDKSEVPTAYSSKEVTFTVEHFSNYVIAYDEERAAVCPQDSTCPISAFTDADPTAWYHDGVHYVLENGIMSGYGNGTFAPNDNTSRAMMAQILWNMEGKPVVNYAMSYTDVDGEAWYTEAVRWATSEKIMSGYGGGKFGPGDAMTREQLVTIMYRYAQYKGVDVSVGEDTNILSYDDALTVSEFAIPAMQWAVGSGAVSGRTNTTLNPKDTATRAEIATIIMRYCEKIAK